jgi:Domain of unknown function (DUF4367)
MNDDFLNQFRKEPRPEFGAALYQRISKPMQKLSKLPALRFAALTPTLFVVLTLTILVSPSARAFAEGFFRQVGGYIFVLGGQPIDPGRGPGPISIVKTLGSVSIQTLGPVPSAKDPTEAGKLAGFPVLVPAYLPTGYSSMSDWFVTSQDGSMVVTNGYRDSTNHFFILNQWNANGGGTRKYARDQIVDVTVRGQAGVWLPDMTNGPAQKNALVWEQGGITYSLITDSLPLDEMLKVAESLK